ncbi:protein NKG7-like [Carettochelys insculpta]|uniref:protein NKG7-like n=1 Tax=Carettochelys insculpta TaxID=44489 RepID=UPI003EC1504B
MRLLRVARPTLALLSLVLLLAALASNHWLLQRKKQYVIHSGLWKHCLNLQCLIPLKVTDFLQATRGCLILAALLGCLSCVALSISFFRSHLGSVSMTLVSAAGSFSAGLCATTAMTLYTLQGAKGMLIPMARVSYNWSFGLGWASCPLFFLTKKRPPPLGIHDDTAMPGQLSLPKDSGGAASQTG